LPRIGTRGYRVARELEMVRGEDPRAGRLSREEKLAVAVGFVREAAFAVQEFEKE